MKSYFLYCLFVVALVYAEKYSVLYDAHNGKFDPIGGVSYEDLQ